MLVYNVYIYVDVRYVELHVFNKHSVKSQTNLLIDCFGERYLKVGGILPKLYSNDNYLYCTD